MSLPRGRNISLSPMRRTMSDFLSFSRAVPLVAMERRVNLSELIAVRDRMNTRPSWFALFLKAYALATIEIGELRQSFLTFPWSRIHQHACSVASMTIVRRLDSEDVIYLAQINQPEEMSVHEIDQRIRIARTAPMEKIRAFQRQVSLGRLPAWIRQFVWWLGLRVRGHWHAKYFGTFGLTGVAALGSSSLNVLSPLTSTLSFGVIESDGNVMVRLYYDHRVMDGVQPALALQRVEEHLLGAVKAELMEQLSMVPGLSIRLAA